MKKLILMGIVLTVLTFTVNAQMERNVGLRLGGNTELSLQSGFGTGFRADVSLGMGFDKQKDSAFSTSIDLVCMSLYVYNFAGGWFVYGGLGGGVESDIKTFKAKDIDLTDILYFKVALDVGLEYQFDDPFAVFVEYRPELALKIERKPIFQLLGVSVGARYMF